MAGRCGRQQTKIKQDVGKATCKSNGFVTSGQEKMYDIIMQTIEQDLPAFVGNIFTYATNPGLIIPAVLLMV